MTGHANIVIGIGNLCRRLIRAERRVMKDQPQSIAQHLYPKSRGSSSSEFGRVKLDTWKQVVMVSVTLLDGGMVFLRMGLVQKIQKIGLNARL